MKKIIKKIWKKTMYIFSSIYIGKNIFIINDINKIPKFKKTYSQFNQDAYVFEKIFQENKNGFFLDVGANHPINANNTYLFEINGWNGLAIEPQDKFRELWKKERRTECWDYVIGEEEKEIIFIEGGEKEHGLSGVFGFNKVSKSNTISIIKKQKRLDNILLEKNIFEVDFLSIDVEGYEMQVLQSLDFNNIKVKVICVENDIYFKKITFLGKYLGAELGNNKIRKFLKSKGYKQVARLMCDDIFVLNK